MKPTANGGKLSGSKNTTMEPELIRMIRTAFDVQMDVSQVQINVPKVKGGGPELVKVPLSDSVADILEHLSDCYAAVRRVRQ